MKTERKTACFFQATITVGCALLTAALIITFMVEANFFVTCLSIAGASAFAGGVIGFGAKYLILRWNEEERLLVSSLQLSLTQLSSR